MRLTIRENWKYDKIKFHEYKILKFSKSNLWVNFIRNEFKNDNRTLEYLELGCAPGICTAAIVKDSNWQISGIDFSDTAEIFLETVSLVKKKANLYKFDFLTDSIDKKFDVVASYGLIEHFEKLTLENVLKIHDYYLNSGGKLIIEVPNFNGFQYFWHYLFDFQDLKIHNLKVMNPEFLTNYYASLGYKIIYCNFIGNLHVWGSSSFNNKFFKFFAKTSAIIINIFSQIISKIGINLSGKRYSPALLLIAIKY